MDQKEWCDILENKFQSEVIREIKKRLPEAIVLKNDSNYKPGIPDLLILYSNKWASLEVKKSEKATCQPNQEYYIQLMKDMSYASFIFPENKEEILNELEQSLRH